jgi:hypothetical protein
VSDAALRWPPPSAGAWGGHRPGTAHHLNYKFRSLPARRSDRALTPYIPDFSYALYDLSGFSDEQIKGTVMARVTLLLFKHIFDPQVRDKLPAVLSLLVELSEKRSVSQYFETVFRYIINTIDQVSVDELTDIVKEALSAKQGEMVMTLAEKLRKERFEKGIEQGMQQGMQQGLIEGIVRGQELCGRTFPDGIGYALFKIKNVYTGFLNDRNDRIQGLADALITV